MEAYPEAVFDVGTTNSKSPLELAAIYNKPTAELFKKHAFETVGQEEVKKFLSLQREREREKRKKEREKMEGRREKEREQMKRRHKEEREEMEGRHKKQCEEMEGRHKRNREDEREEERKDEREELEREHKRKREEEREEREREHERRNDCPICLEALNAQECACTPCGHIFHRECVGKSLRTGSGECPTCREKFRSLNLRTIYL
ncbi:RING-type domain-containing protein [Pycnococcus provasolii]